MCLYVNDELHQKYLKVMSDYETWIDGYEIQIVFLFLLPTTKRLLI